MRFSLRRLMGFITFGCVVLGAVITVGPHSTGFYESLRGILVVFLVIGAAPALYAALDPWVGYPAKLDTDLSRTANPRFIAGAVTLTLSILTGLCFAAMGYIGVTVLIGGGLSFDTGGAKTADLLRGSGLIAATCIGAFARGACWMGFLCLMCGSPLGRRWAPLLGLCGGSLIALLLWRLTGDITGVVKAGFAGLLMLLAGGALAWWSVARGTSFGRRSRRWGARLFLLGMAMGAAAAMKPNVQWLLFWEPPISLLLGAVIGSSLGAIVGLLAGAAKVDPPAVDDEGDDMDEAGGSPFASP